MQRTMRDGSDKFLTEKELIEGCRKNDARAQRRLYELFAPTMLAVCIRYTGSRENAKDVLQEGFLTVFDKIGTYKGQGSFVGWMRRVFANQSLMYIRRNDALKYADEIESVPESGLGLDSDDPLGKLNAKDTGNAAAIKEFVSLYEEFSTVVKNYIIVLNSDLSRVMSAAGQMSDVDKSEGVFIQGLKSGDKFRR